MTRGGAWKPRSSPDSFPGYGAQGVRWLLEAAVSPKWKPCFFGSDGGGRYPHR